MPRFVVCLVILFAALLLGGCATFADLLPAGPVTPIPPDRVVVFGKIEHKWEQQYGSSGTSNGMFGFLKILPSRLADSWQKKTFIGHLPANDALSIHISTGSDFYVLLPRENYLFETLNFSFLTTHEIICRNFGFRVPPAAAVYVGTLVFHEKEKGFLFTARSTTLSVLDEYEQAVRRLRARNPGLQGPVARSLFRHEPFLDPQALECRTRKGGFLLLR